MSAPRQDRHVLRRRHIMTASVASLMIAGCASTEVVTQEAYQGEQLPLADRIIVHDFAATLDEVAENSTVPTTASVTTAAPTESDVNRIPEDTLAAFGSFSRPVDISLPYQGRYIGSALPTVSNASAGIQAGAYGHRVIIPYDGNLKHVQINTTSGRGNGADPSKWEGSKSRINGDGKHPINKDSWPLRMTVQAADANWQPTGPVLRTINFNHFRKTRDDGRSRQIHQLDLEDLPVSAGQRLLFWLTNTGTDPVRTYVNYNFSGGWLAKTGLNPPRHRNLLYGDNMTFVRGENPNGTNMNPVYRSGANPGHIGGIGLRYSDGREFGDTNMDGGNYENVFRFYIGGNLYMRQALKLPNQYYRFKELWLAIYTIDSPAAPLTVRITGSDISPIIMSLPASAFPVQVSESVPYEMVRFPLPTPFIGTPNSTYTVTLYSPAAGNGNYRIHANRRFFHPRDPANAAPIGAKDHPIDDFEYSENHGSSWKLGGYSGKGQSFLPVGLFSDGDVATTEAGLRFIPLSQVSLACGWCTAPGF